MNATSRFLPRARSPWCVDGPSASASPVRTFWPPSTRDFWLMHVPWLDRRHVVDLTGCAVGGAGRADPHARTLGATTHEDAFVHEAAPVVEGRVRLGDDVLLLLIGGQIDDLVGDLAVRHLAVGGLDEPEVV